MPDLGTWLTDRPRSSRPRPPWEDIFTELAASGRFAPPGLPLDGYLGAAVHLAAFAEHSALGGFEPSGVFAGLAPYLRREPGDLPELPVPLRFGELLHWWARGAVAFVESAGS